MANAQIFTKLYRDHNKGRYDEFNEELKEAYKIFENKSKKLEDASRKAEQDFTLKIKEHRHFVPCSHNGPRPRRARNTFTVILLLFPIIVLYFHALK